MQQRATGNRQQPKTMTTINTSDKATSTGSETMSLEDNNDDGNNDNDNKDSDKQLDDEGLHKEYDVILVGTGLVQSIVAAALARSGTCPRILHTDPADYYGEFDAVWTLPYLLNQHEKREKQKHKESNVTEHGKLEEEDTATTIETNNNDDVDETCTIILSRRGATSSLKVHEMVVQDKSEIGIGTKVSTPFGVGVVTEWTEQQEMEEEKEEEIVEQQQQTKRDDDDDDNNESNKSNNKNNKKYTRMAIELEMTRPGFHHGERSSSFSSSSPKSSNKKHHHRNKNQKTKTKTTLYVGIPSSSSSNDNNNNNNNVRPLCEIQARTILEKHSRSFALDISPCLLFADGSAVSGLLQGNVAEYLEFKALEGVLIYNSKNNNNNGNKSTKSNNNNNNTNNHHEFVTVPCSKNSVFRCNYLSPIEKRRLVKFLQLALEYYHASLEEEEEKREREKQQKQQQEQDSSGNTQKAAAATAVLSLNERHLNQGRSLARPQNKALTDLSSLRDCIAANMDLDTYLKQKQNLSQKLVDLVRYAMMLETSTASSVGGGESQSSLSLKQGITSLCKHVHALGRYGTTAFIVPLYGNELSQAFCRCAAVYGTTYLLRRKVIGYSVVNREKDSGCDSDNAAATTAVHEAILETTQQQSSSKEEEQSTAGAKVPSTHTTRKRVRCKHLIVPQQALRQSTTAAAAVHHRRRRVLRRISILRGKPNLVDTGKHNNDNNNKDGLLYSSHQQRHLVLFPPKSVADDQRNVIQALLLDEHVNVAPHIGPCGCTVVHLTTTVDNISNDDEEDDDSSFTTSNGNVVLEKALQALLRDTPKDDLDEIFHVTFSYALDEEEDTSSEECQSSPADFHGKTEGLHVIKQTKQPLVVDEAFEQAQDVFERICPDHGINFLELAEKLKSDIKERLGDAALQNPNDQDDQDERVLAKAMELIQSEKQQQPPPESAGGGGSSGGGGSGSGSGSSSDDKIDGQEGDKEQKVTTTTEKKEEAA